MLVLTTTPWNKGLKFSMWCMWCIFQCIRIYFVVAASSRVMLDLRSTGHSLCTRLRRKQSSFQVFPKWVNMSEICPRPHHQKRNSKCTVCWVVLLYATWNSQVGEPTRQFPKNARISGYSNSEMTINHAMSWFWCNQKLCEQFTTKHWPKHRPVTRGCKPISTGRWGGAWRAWVSFNPHDPVSILMSCTAE